MPVEHRHHSPVPADPTLDVWAFGATLFECAVGTPPRYDAGSPWPPWPTPHPSISDGFIGLVNLCLALKPGDRPDIASILSLPCLKSLPNTSTIRTSKWCEMTSHYHAFVEDREKRPHGADCPKTPPSACACISHEIDRSRGREVDKEYLVPLWAQRRDCSITVEVAKVVVGMSESATAADPSLVDRAWAALAEATRDGRLGFAAKLSRRNAAEPAIIVYIEDAKDEENKKRVISEINSITERVGFVPLTGDGKPLGEQNCWKTDHQTNMKLYSSFADGLGLRK